VADRVEQVLARAARVLAAIAPGAVFPTPLSRVHRMIGADLGGRVIRKLVNPESFGPHAMPYLCSIFPSGQKVVLTTHEDGEMYEAAMPLMIVGLCADQDGGDGPYVSAQTQTNILRADVMVAMESLPYWTGPEQATKTADPNFPGIPLPAVPIALSEEIGHIGIVAKDFEVNVFDEAAWAELVMSYTVHFAMPWWDG
jgi:hypothetical protein